MGRQGVDLRNTRHTGNEGGTDRAARADKIALAFTVPDKLLCDHVKHRKAVFDDGRQLTVQAVTDKVGQGVTVPIVGTVPAQLLQILLCPLHVRG